MNKQISDLIIEDSVTTLKSYLYLDEIEINELYSQLYEDVVEKTVKKTSKHNDSVDGSLEGNVFGLVKADGSYKQGSDCEETTEIRTRLSVARKANILVSYVCNNRIHSIDEVIRSSINSNILMRGRIIVGYGQFALTSIWDNNNQPIDLMSSKGNYYDIKSSTLVLERGATHSINEMVRYNDNDHDAHPSEMRSPYCIEMRMGGDKMRRELRHLTNTIRKGKSFHLIVLGQLSCAGGKYYAIKPFAVW